MTPGPIALENGADPSTVAGWIAEVQAERVAAERSVLASTSDRPQLTPDDVRALIEKIGDIPAASATPRRRRRPICTPPWVSH
jgi:hypothetical protein